MTTIFKTWELTTEHSASSYGRPVLVHRPTGDAFGSADIVRPYPSWGFMLARDAVRRMASSAAGLTDDDIRLVAKFVGA